MADGARPAISSVERWWRPVAVGVAALLARALYWALVVPTYSFPLSDASHYQQIARNLADGRGFVAPFPSGALHATAFRPPLYPMLLGATYKVFGDGVASGRALSVVLGVAVAVLAYLLANRIAGPLAGLVAGGLVAIYPPLLANDTVTLTEPLSLALLLGTFLALAGRRWVWAGVLVGLLVLTRASAQYLVVVVGLWLLWQIGWKRALGFVGIAALVVAPWIVRNEVQLGGAVLVTSNGFNYAAIYSPPAQTTAGFVDPVADPWFAEQGVTTDDEIVWQRQLQRIAIDNLKDNPRLLPAVMKRNLLSYFELTPDKNEVAEYFDGRNQDFRSAGLPLFYVVTVLGLVGMVLRWREPLVALLLGVTAYFVLTSLVLVTAPRLRAPFDALCCIGVGLVVAWAVERRRGRAPAPPPLSDPAPA
jgi:4-amino-4-deoxy-L-arabinose transferase-like glycosyltransferase